MGVKKGLSRMFSIRGLMPGNTFTREDVQTLFMDACKDLIDELRPYQ